MTLHRRIEHESDGGQIKWTTTRFLQNGPYHANCLGMRVYREGGGVKPGHTCMFGALRSTFCDTSPNVLSPRLLTPSMGQSTKTLRWLSLGPLRYSSTSASSTYWSTESVRITRWASQQNLVGTTCYVGAQLLLPTLSKVAGGELAPRAAAQVPTPDTVDKERDGKDVDRWRPGFVPCTPPNILRQNELHKKPKHELNAQVSISIPSSGQQSFTTLFRGKYNRKARWSYSGDPAT